VLLFGDRTSPGARGLITDCERLGRPLVWVETGRTRPSHVADFLRSSPHFRTVMVAGNRESRAPGIGARVERFLCDVFRRLGCARS
jgi:Circularly permutated YpsA SLOG family